jgi:predicted transcriptional regulator
MKMNLQAVERGGIHFIYVAQDRDRWRELVNAVMKFWVKYYKKMRGIS